MSVNLNEDTVRNPQDTDVRGVLETLQGNILQAHGRDYAVYLFLQFTEEVSRVREVLSSYLPRIVTSAAKQFDDARKFASSKVDGGLFATFFLSAAGYRYLGFTNAQLKALLPEPSGGQGFRSNFIEGMKAHASELRDPDPKDERLEAGYKEEIHALLLLAHDDQSWVKQAERSSRDALAGIARVVVAEDGYAPRDENLQAYEHFGFADGISQPVFLQKDADASRPAAWNPVEPLSLVLVEDGAAPVAGVYGSFFVFRKLEQDVRGFAERTAELAKTLRVSPEQVGAKAVGRFRDGTPLAVAQASGTGAVNDFVYGATTACPMHAHIRKANPRGDFAPTIGFTEEVAERSHRIVRRGIPYGDRPKKPFQPQSIAEMPTAGVGILFGCYQASIANQFAFIQSRWLNRVDFPQDRVGIDPITGSQQAGSANDWGAAPDRHEVRENFGQFVTFKGGEFFFAPSIPFLGVLAPVSR